MAKSGPVSVAIVQMTCVAEKQPNIDKAVARIGEAAARGAHRPAEENLAEDRGGPEEGVPFRHRGSARTAVPAG